MPPQPGETTLLTIFADVHYFFAPETQKPIHHRFEKGSYVYIHQNNADGRGRIEVANNAGTPGQDAFAGALELAHITYTYKKPTFFSIALPPAPQIQQKPWQIPAFDLRHERKYMYPIHAIDLYLWGPEDAVDLVEALSAVEPIGGLNVEAPPPDEDQPDPNDNLSPVVQQLEQAAIGSPYKRESTSTTQSSLVPSATSAEHPAATEQTQASAESSAAFAAAPLAYNPAAPAAPETRVYREKTPPPPEGSVPIGPSISQSYQGQQQQQRLGSYPYTQQAQGPQAAAFAGASPPPPPTQQHHQAASPPVAPSFPPPPSASPPSGAATLQQGYNTQPLASPGFPPQQQQAYQQQYQQTPPQQYQPQPQQQFQQQYLPQQQQQQTYSTYSYNTTNAAPPPAHAIHQQFYRPTEAEAGRVHAVSMGPSALTPQQMQAPPGQQGAAAGRTGKVSRVEKGVNSFFAKLDKKF